MEVGKVAAQAEQMIRPKRALKGGLKGGPRGPVKRYRNQTFWAENGIIHIVDERDGAHEAVSVREWLQRILSIRAMVDRVVYADERWELQRLLEDMVFVGRRAQRQGDPIQRLFGGTPGGVRGEPVPKELLARKRPSGILVPGRTGWVEKPLDSKEGSE